MPLDDYKDKYGSLTQDDWDMTSPLSSAVSGYTYSPSKGGNDYGPPSPFDNSGAGYQQPSAEMIASTPRSSSSPGFADWWSKIAPDRKKSLGTGLLSAGLNLMASAGRTSPTPISSMGLLGEAGLHGLGAYQQQEQLNKSDKRDVLQNALLGYQVAQQPLHQQILQGQASLIPAQLRKLEAEAKQRKSLTPTDLALEAARGNQEAIKALELSKSSSSLANPTPYSTFYRGQKNKNPDKTDEQIANDWAVYQKDIQGQYKPSEYLTFYNGVKQENPNITDNEIAKKWLEYTQNKGLNSYQTVQTAGTLRSEIKNNPYVKEFQDINTKFAVMGKALDESKVTGDKIATDQALITLFNKMTDPESVVRESEYARTSGDASVMNKLKGKIAQMQMGGAGLTDEDRQALYTMANKFYDVYSRNYDETVANYKELAKASGIKENLIGIPYERKLNMPTGKIKIPTREEFIKTSIEENKLYSPEELGSFYDTKYGGR